MRYVAAINGVVVGAVLVASWPIGLFLAIDTALVWALFLYRRHLDSKGCSGL